jgi:hypothetical protein
VDDTALCSYSRNVVVGEDLHTQVVGFDTYLKSRHLVALYIEAADFASGLSLKNGRWSARCWRVGDILAAFLRELIKVGEGRLRKP